MAVSFVAAGPRMSERDQPDLEQPPNTKPMCAGRNRAAGCWVVRRSAQPWRAWAGAGGAYGPAPRCQAGLWQLKSPDPRGCAAGYASPAWAQTAGEFLGDLVPPVFMKCRYWTPSIKKCC